MSTYPPYPSSTYFYQVNTPSTLTTQPIFNSGTGYSDIGFFYPPLALTVYKYVQLNRLHIVKAQVMGCFYQTFCGLYLPGGGKGSMECRDLDGLCKKCRAFDELYRKKKNEHT